MRHFDGSLFRRQIAVTLLVASILATSSFAVTNRAATQRNRPANPRVAETVVPAPGDVNGFTPGDDRKQASWAQIVDRRSKTGQGPHSYVCISTAVSRPEHRDVAVPLQCDRCQRV